LICSNEIFRLTYFPAFRYLIIDFKNNSYASYLIPIFARCISIKEMITIYTPKVTARVKYTFNLFFKHLLNSDYCITNNIDEFLSSEGSKFSYCDKPVSDELHFWKHPILTENNILEQNISIIPFAESKAFFPTPKNSAMPFDVFAATFYLLSRYEEYLPYIKDMYGRFSAKESLAFKQGFLYKPVVNIWAIELSKVIQQHFPDFQTKKNTYKFTPTLDIDSAYAYRLKGFIRSTGGYLKSLYHLDFKEIIERTNVFMGLEQDHFDTYEYQFSLQKKYNIKPIYFILFGIYGQYDKNLPVNNKRFQNLIKTLADYAEVGIHPTFASNNNEEMLKNEIESLSKVLNRQITKSRQHFLKLSLPETYRSLVKYDITDDYTMGFALEPGFRAGICTPFPFFDLEMDEELPLMVHPFTFMEGTFRDYKQMNAEESWPIIKQLIDEVKAVNGTFISLWHNESLSDKKRWVGWRKLYEQMYEHAL
jgi:hypothetical protein